MILSAVLAAFGILLAPAAVTSGDDAELLRLVGQKVERSADGYRIVSIAGEGPPVVGIVERVGPRLALVTVSGQRLWLAGPLATPRIAGPGYKVWVVGDITGGILHARRLGILRPPPRLNVSGAKGPAPRRRSGGPRRWRQSRPWSPPS
ncbi:MAG TPA: hypothetical protein VFG83_15660 [Kofleriaceae bacterium]|nr:hypothetical protein [Kofleriaceae bacterium]